MLTSDEMRLHDYVPDETQRTELLHVLKNGVGPDEKSVIILVSGGGSVATRMTLSDAILMTICRLAIDETVPQTNTDASLFVFAGSFKEKGQLYVTSPHASILRHSYDMGKEGKARVIHVQCGRPKDDKRQLIDAMKTLCSSMD